MTYVNSFQMPRPIGGGANYGYPNIDRSHWATQNLVHCWYWNDPSQVTRQLGIEGTKFPCLVTGTVLSAPVAEDSGFVGEEGFFRCIALAGIGKYWTATLPKSISAPMTMVVVHKHTDGVVPWMLGQDGAWTGWYGNNAHQVVSTNAADFSGNATPYVVETHPHGLKSLAFTMSGTNDLRATIGGSPISSDTSCAAPAGTQNRLMLGSSTQPDNYADCDFDLICIWTRSFSNSELLNISINPYQIFSTEKRRRPYFFAPTVSFQPAWARSANTILSPAGAGYAA